MSIIYTYTQDSSNNFIASAIGFSEQQGQESGSLIIPSTVFYLENTYTVTSIGNNAFMNRLGFTSLTIPNSVTSIGNNAFNTCYGFTGSLTIPDSVTSIGNSAFEYCSGFSGSLIIGNAVEIIGSYAFSTNSTDFTGSLTIPNSVTSIGDGAFSSSTFDSLVIGNSVTSIGSYAFSDCTGFTGSLTIPNSVISIGEGAFLNCYQFSSLVIGNNVTSIGNIAFNTCSGFTGSLTIPNSVTSIGNSAFLNTDGIINVIVGDQSICTVQTDSFTDVSRIQGSYIKYYSTQSADNLTSNWLAVSSNYANTIYDINPACLNEGTKILCLNKNFEEEYIPIQNLRKGDLVKSYKHGYRKIDLIGKNVMINEPNNFCCCMYKMGKTETNGLIEDLIVTGGHSILVDELGIHKKENENIFGTQIIDDKFLLLSSVSKDFVKLDNINVYTYYHFILENNGDNEERFGVYANGILTETPPKKNFITMHLNKV